MDELVIGGCVPDELKARTTPPESTTAAARSLAELRGKAVFVIDLGIEKLIFCAAGKLPADSSTVRTPDPKFAEALAPELGDENSIMLGENV